MRRGGLVEVEEGPVLSLMLHFHRKWSISSKSISGGFRNMIIHAAKRMSLLRDDARQFRAKLLPPLLRVVVVVAIGSERTLMFLLYFKSNDILLHSCGKKVLRMTQILIFTVCRLSFYDGNLHIFQNVTKSDQMNCDYCKVPLCRMEMNLRRGSVVEEGFRMPKKVLNWIHLQDWGITSAELVVRVHLRWLGFGCCSITTE